MRTVAHLISHPSTHQTTRFFLGLVRTFFRLR